MPEALLELLKIPVYHAAAVLLGSFVVAYVVEVLFGSVILLLVRKTETTLDDAIVAILRRPIFLTVLLLGLAWAIEIVPTSARTDIVAAAALKTAAVVVWTGAGFRLTSLVLKHFSQHAREGKVKALGTTGLARSAVLPQVPTIAESGVPGYEATIWLGVMAPKATSPAIVARLNAEIVRIVSRQEKACGAGFQPAARA